MPLADDAAALLETAGCRQPGRVAAKVIALVRDHDAGLVRPRPLPAPGCPWDCVVGAELLRHVPDDLRDRMRQAEEARRGA